MFQQNLQPQQLLEALENEIPLIVCITEGIPVLDMIKVKEKILQIKISFDWTQLPRNYNPRRMQNRYYARKYSFTKGSCGIVSRSGTLTYEAVSQTT